MVVDDTEYLLSAPQCIGTYIMLDFSTMGPPRSPMSFAWSWSPKNWSGPLLDAGIPRAALFL